MHSDKKLYRQLRELNCAQLLDQEIPAFDRASSRERAQRVSLIRAVGVVFAAQGTFEQCTTVRTWLRRLLKDPEEKVRRYAMAALPKLGAGAREESELLTLLQSTQVEREKKFLGRALHKIGGEATLHVAASASGLLPEIEQKLKANVARQQSPSAIRLDLVLTEFADLKIYLRCRRGLEDIVAEEAKDSPHFRRKFRVTDVHEGVVSLLSLAPFALADLYSLRCFATVSFVLGTLPESGPDDAPEAAVDILARTIASPLTRTLMQTFSEGSLRYRLEFIGKSHQGGMVAPVIDRAYALCPEILNDARSAPWAIDVHALLRGRSVELRPKLTPDPRLGYRQEDVLAASHPPLAAALARVAGRQSNEIVWDPFCGSGLELIERALLGGVTKLYGTDLSAAALAVAQANFSAAKLGGVEAQFTCGDFREYARVAGLGPQSVSLIITNPPMGRRIRVPNLRGLISDLLAVAAKVLRPGGRLVLVNPLKIDLADSPLQLRRRQTVDLGGFDCRLELYEMRS